MVCDPDSEAPRALRPADIREHLGGRLAMGAAEGGDAPPDDADLAELPRSDGRGSGLRLAESGDDEDPISSAPVALRADALRRVLERIS